MEQIWNQIKKLVTHHSANNKFEAQNVEKATDSEITIVEPLTGEITANLLDTWWMKYSQSQSDVELFHCSTDKILKFKGSVILYVEINNSLLIMHYNQLKLESTCIPNLIFFHSIEKES